MIEINHFSLPAIARTQLESHGSHHTTDDRISAKLIWEISLLAPNKCAKICNRHTRVENSARRTSKYRRDRTIIEN